MSAFDNDDFMQVAAQLLQMSMADSQAYLNYLSSRLRVMASLFFGRNVATQDPDIYTWFTENMFRELTNAITVLGCLTSGSRVLEVPQYLRRCMRGHPHLSKRYSDNDSDVPDSPIDGLGDHWYTQIPLRPEVPKMHDLLTTWSRQNLMAEMTTAFTPASLSDEGLLSLKSAYEKYREILRAAIEQETARYNQLIDEREAVQTALIEAERVERQVMVRKLTDAMFEDVDSDESSENDQETFASKQPVPGVSETAEESSSEVEIVE
ncbi:hypothetical protein BDZ97DRAFT_1922970 [Flammula alnicola]|nr:hypothetical protein BDZ97DRAFT_1931351 [Flammula alnicola]KAF8959271.1 hypothetical protein BDZ97DRAFT_1922970 [Flammula alnicola]